jgi:hypothetical protein
MYQKALSSSLSLWDIFPGKVSADSENISIPRLSSKVATVFGNN